MAFSSGIDQPSIQAVPAALVVRDWWAGSSLQSRFAFAEGHSDIAQSLYNHAVALDRLGQRTSARRAFREAASIKSAFASENLVGVTVDVRALDRR